MKKLLLIMSLVALVSTAALAKNEKKVIFTVEPKMHCENCEKKITEALRFEKGVSDVVTSIKNQTVTVTYDAEKNNPANFQEALAKAKYKATIVKPNEDSDDSQIVESATEEVVEESCCNTKAPVI